MALFRECSWKESTVIKANAAGARWRAIPNKTAFTSYWNPGVEGCASIAPSRNACTHKAINKTSAEICWWECAWWWSWACSCVWIWPCSTPDVKCSRICCRKKPHKTNNPINSTSPFPRYNSGRICTTVIPKRYAPANTSKSLKLFVLPPGIR